MNDNDFGFALPAFKPDEALQRLRRDLRALGLTERGDCFERRGLAIARAAVEGEVLKLGLVKRPARTPQWAEKTAKDSAQLRDFVALVKKSLATWSDADE